MSTLKLAVAQMAITDGDYAANIARIERIVEQAGPEHDLLVLPETATSGFSRREEVARIAEPLDGPTVRRLSVRAAAHDCLLVLGLPERAGDSLYNSAVVIGPEGVVMAYRKTHLWGAEKRIFAAGDCFRAADRGAYVLGALVCYDVEFPEPARALATMGCGLIALCNGNMDPYGEVHRRAIVARAQENQLFVAMANRVGAGRDETFAGGSMVVGPNGTVLAEMAGGEGVLSVGIDMAQVAACRRSYNYLEDRRVGLQGGLVHAADGLFEYGIAARPAR